MEAIPWLIAYPAPTSPSGRRWNFALEGVGARPPLGRSPGAVAQRSSRDFRLPFVHKDSPAISQETPLPSFQNTYGVLRVDVTRPTGTPAHLWVVSVTRHGRVYNRNFTMQCRNKESAWLMAVAYRDALLRLFLPTRGWNAAHRSIPATPRALLVCLQGTTKNTSKAGQPC